MHRLLFDGQMPIFTINYRWIDVTMSKPSGFRFLNACGMMLLCSVGFAQVDIESVARLHFAIEAHPNQWFEGYNGPVSGSFSPYQSHRSSMNRDSAYVARTSGGESMIEWKTAPIPDSWDGDSASFLWECGFGNNLGNEWFDVDVNNTFALSFSTTNNSSWSVSAKQGLRLFFVTVSRNSNGANLGYMVLRVHRSHLAKGSPVEIRVRGRSVKTEIWYRLFAYKDAIHYLRNKEDKDYFSQLELRNLGDASYILCARRNVSGSTVRLLSSSSLIAENKLRPDGDISISTVFIPRSIQPDSSIPTLVQTDDKTIDTIRWEAIATRRLEAFMDEELECEKYIFPPGDLPAIRWKQPLNVENELGDFPLRVTYYDWQMNKVTRAEKAGRYAAVIEGRTPAGFDIKRYITLYCAPIEFDDYSRTVPLKMNKLQEYGIAEEKWNLYAKEEQRFSFGSLKMYPHHDPDAAIFLAGLAEMDTLDVKFDTPRNNDRQWWVTFKHLERNTKSHAVPYALPKKVQDDRSSLIEEMSTDTSPYSTEQLENIRKICRAWWEKGGEPLVTLIAYKGRIVFHEIFGSKEDGQPIEKNSQMWMASITKLLTGALMMRFVDQGLVDLDTPVSRYLPELSGDALTVRHLFTHTTGLHPQGEWASDWNVALENQIAQLLPTVQIGSSFSYHRIGYAVAGRIMEQITGRAIPTMFQEYLFAPLGMKSAYADNTYGGLYCTAIDLARFGQMLLNRGVYNGYRFFSEESYAKMLPARLANSNRRWGIGTSPMDGHGLSESAFGHGAASGAVFRIDPKNDLIIISARNRIGKSHDEFENRLIEACAVPIENH